MNARLVQLLVLLMVLASLFAKAKWQVGFFDGH
jgi:hypothetical protein